MKKRVFLLFSLLSLYHKVNEEDYAVYFTVTQLRLLYFFEKKEQRWFRKISWIANDTLEKVRLNVSRCGNHINVALRIDLFTEYTSCTSNQI